MVQKKKIYNLNGLMNIVKDRGLKYIKQLYFLHTRAASPLTKWLHSTTLDKVPPRLL